MRLLIIAIGLVFLSVKVNAQTLQGKVSNTKDTIVTLLYNYDYAFDHFDTIKLNSKNEFRKTFSFKGIGLVKMISNNLQYDFVLFPGATLSFTADLTDYASLHNTIRLKGRDAALNISHKLLTDPALKSLNFDYDLPSDKFVQRMQDWRRVRDSLRNTYVNASLKKPYNRNVQEYLKVDSINTLFWTVFAMRDYHSFVLGNKNEQDSFYLTLIKPYMIQYDDDAHLNSEMYRSIWGKRISDHWRWKKETGDTTGISNISYTAYLLQQMATTLQGKLKIAAISRYLQKEYAVNYEEIPLSKYAYYDSLMLVYSKDLPNPGVVRSVQGTIAVKKEMRIKTEKGAWAANFKVVDSTGKTVRLSDFKGKLVYVDVWASWCGPCIAELPAYKTLVSNFKNRTDIVFVSISIDSKKKEWMDLGVNKHLPPGLQLWAGEAGGSSEFAQQYFIRYVPKYILIDKEGKLINYNLESPSDPQSRKSIEEALGM